MKLKDLCTMKSGGTPSRSNLSYWNNGYLPWAKISDLETSKDGFIYDTEEKITDEGLNSINNRWFKKGTLLLAMYGSVGKTAISKIDLTTNQAILGIEINDPSKLDINYLRFWFQTIKAKLMDRAVGAALLNISLAIVKDLQIPLPDLATQKAIAAKLDKADEIRQLNKKLIEQYDALTQSLFLDMFGDPVKNEKGWEVKTLENLCDNIVDCPHSTPKKVDYLTNYPCIRTSEIKLGQINWTTMQYLDEEEYVLRTKRLKPEADDIVYAREGTYGDGVILPSGHNFALGQRTMLFRVDRTQVTPIYFHQMLRSDYVYNQAKRKNSGTTVGHINIKDIRQFTFLVPPLTLQNEFAERVKAIEAQKALAQQALQQSEDLFNSLLQESFQ